MRWSGEGKGETAPWMLRPRNPAMGEAPTEEGRELCALAKLVEALALQPCSDDDRLLPVLRLGGWP